MTIANVTATTADLNDRAAGLLAYLQVQMDGGLILEGITLRRTLTGQLCLSFPERVARNGRRHPLMRPRDDNARRDFERQVFALLQLDEEEIA